MEEEEREAQSAKLQELIRRGNPEDLQEANRLMKIMAGYDTRSKTDYRAKAAEDVGKIQAKARLLEERLAAFQPGDKMTEGDVFEELASALSSAQPKIQKMCEEESDDHEAVAKLLEINDSIHRTVERWKLLKKGDIEGANAIAQGAPIQSLQSSGGQASSSAANELSLIDFDADASGTNGSGNNGESSSQAAGVESDLLGLSLDGGSSTFGQGGGISLGFGANSSMSSHEPQVGEALLTPQTDIPGQPLLSSMTQNSNATGAVNAPTPPSYTQFSGLTSPPAGSQSNTPQPQAPSAFSQPSQKPAADPFAALTSPMFGSKPATPQPQAMAAAPAPVPAPAAATNEDDEWSFSSALPPEVPSLPKDHAAVVKTGEVQIDMKAARSVQSPNALALSFAFSSNAAQPVSELHFQLAVTKVSPRHRNSS